MQPGQLPEYDIVTWVGTTVHLRPIRPADSSALVAFHSQLSRQSVYRRYFFMHTELSAAEVERLTRVDCPDRVAYVAWVDGELVGVGRYDRSPGTTEAEVAFVVADTFHHHGIATLLLELLTDIALGNGITTFFALTLVENRDMLHVFKDMGFVVNTELDNGTIGVRFCIAPNETSRSRRAARHAARSSGPCEASSEAIYADRSSSA